jgi:Flp pilus assembly protein TadD
VRNLCVSFLVVGLCIAQQGEEFLRQGLLALGRNELESARRQLEAASKLSPADPRVWLGLARTYWKAGQKELASKAIAQAASTGKDEPGIQHGLAMYYAEAGQWEQAAGFESRYASASGDPDAFFRAASLYLEARKPEQAIQLSRKALEKGDRADVRNLLGKALEAVGDPAQALAEFQAAVRLNPYEEAYYFDLAQMLMRHHNFDTAIVVLEASKKMIAKSPQLELALGVAYYGQRRFPDAVNSFLRTIDLDPGVRQSYLYLARILDSAVDRMPEIEKKFAAFSAANPNSALGPFLVAKAKYVQLPSSGYPPEAEKAESLLRESLLMKEDEWETHHLLGSLLERKGDADGAISALKRAIELDERNPAPHFPLARAYLRKGMKEEAARERTRFKELTEAQETAIQQRAASMKKLQVSLR